MSKTVLVVDDDPAFLSALSQSLNDVGYSVVTARDGREAMEVIGNCPSLDAAIVDLALPDIGGFQIIAELGKVQKSPIPLLAVTGAYGDVYLEVAEYLGASASLRKPGDGEPLTTVVEAVGLLLK